MSDKKQNAIDLETIRAIKELLGNSHRQDAVPVVSVPRDRDSFATFTGGLRENWVFVMALFAIGIWGTNQLSDINAVNITQQNQIDQNIKQLEVLTTAFNASQQAANTSSNEIVRRLDNMQKDIEIIKASK